VNKLGWPRGIGGNTFPYMLQEKPYSEVFKRDGMKKKKFRAAANLYYGVSKDDVVDVSAVVKV
jgi:hypothetical protein